MCNPILVGMAIGGGMAAIQGGGIKEIAMGAAFGAAGAGIASGGVGAFGNVFSAVPGQFLTAAASAAATGAGIGATFGSFITGTGMFAQPDYSQFGYGAQPYEPQGYSYQHATVTGSGGRQAAGVLAEEIKRTRTLRQRQQEETTAYNVAGELASTGLQIA